MSSLLAGLGLGAISAVIGSSRERAEQSALQKTKHLGARFHNLFFEMYRASDPETKALFADQIGRELSTMGKDWRKYAKDIRKKNW
jgi:hypothetical protein